MNNEQITINNYSISVLESLFTSMKGAGYKEILDASIYMYENVKKEGIYPSKIVAGFYSAMAILEEMSLDQFWQVKSIYC